MARFAAIGWMGVAVLLVGCPDRDDFGLGQNTDDDDDDIMGDDDSADDDTENIPGPWTYYGLDIAFEATGGTGGGDANVYITQTYYDGEEIGMGDYLCSRDLEFRTVYTYGRDQDPEIFGYADEILTWTSGEETRTDCYEGYDTTVEDLMDEWQWKVNPLVFVSCDSVLADPELLDMEITLDPFIWQEEVTDGTFHDFCELIGPAASYFFHTGLHEAIWLMPGSWGDLAEFEDVEFNYFAPADTSNVEVWMFYGFSVAAADNKDEPIEGLEGTYEIVPLWLWYYPKEEA